MSSPVFIQRKLLAWYRSSARDLPWRRTKDPYAIWVSEIMLQQTQVQTVIAYYERWLRRFPSLEALADADIQDVLEIWAGLGYYRRARMIHEAARQINQASKGIIPETVEELVKLPGIGRYTAGAISSIAFGRRAPVLDGNVIRVLSRIYAVEEDVFEKKTQDRLWSLAEALLPDDAPGDLNQALMELGATVCFPQNPACGQCPAAEVCRARAQSRQTSFPVKREKEKLEKMDTFAVVLRSRGRFLLRKQPHYGRWGGLWMFPFWQTRASLLEACRLSEDDISPLTVIVHGFTKYRVRLQVFECVQEAARREPAGVSEGSEDRWVAIEDLGSYALPAPHKRILKEVMEKYAAQSPA